MSGNNHTHENRNIRGSPQPWGYIHQKVSPACDIYFIKRLQSATQNVAILFYRTIAGSSIGSISPKFIPYKTFVNVHGITDMILTYYCYKSISFTRPSFDNEIDRRIHEFSCLYNQSIQPVMQVKYNNITHNTIKPSQQVKVITCLAIPSSLFGK